MMDNAKINLAYNIGIAIDDLAIASLIYRKALEEKIGQEIEISNYETSDLF